MYGQVPQRFGSRDFQIQALIILSHGPQPFILLGFNLLPTTTPTRLDMAHEKLIRLLNVLWLLLVLPAVVAVLVGFVSHSATLGIKTFLLIEFGIAILSPLLTAIIERRDTSHRNRGK
jgi:hypothetical protein